VTILPGQSVSDQLTDRLALLEHTCLLIFKFNYFNDPVGHWGTVVNVHPLGVTLSASLCVCVYT
jgi:hypothetical protein